MKNDYPILVLCQIWKDENEDDDEDESKTAFFIPSPNHCHREFERPRQ